jgi:hypothetical protein
MGRWEELNGVMQRIENKLYNSDSFWAHLFRAPSSYEMIEIKKFMC